MILEWFVYLMDIRNRCWPWSTMFTTVLQKYIKLTFYIFREKLHIVVTFSLTVHSNWLIMITKTRIEKILLITLSIVSIYADFIYFWLNIIKHIGTLSELIFYIHALDKLFGINRLLIILNFHPWVWVFWLYLQNQIIFPFVYFFLLILSPNMANLMFIVNRVMPKYEHANFPSQSAPKWRQ